MDTRIKVALVGLGKIADYHIRAIEKNPKLELVGGYDVIGDPENKLKNRRLYGSLAELLEDDSIHTVFVLIPIGQKHAVSLEIIGAGKNLITEKPTAKDTKELEELFLEAKKRNVIFGGFFHSRYSGTAKKITEMLETPEYSRTGIQEIKIWTDSPHVIDGKMVGKPSETTSFLDEGPNILAEADLYVDGISIDHTQVDTSLAAEGWPEIETKIEGKFQGGKIEGTTSWVRGKKEKGVEIKFKSGKILRAIHTDQKVYNEKGEIIFDGEKENPGVARLQKEYDSLYEGLFEILTRKEEANTELMRSVTVMMDGAYQARMKTDRGMIQLENSEIQKLR